MVARFWVSFQLVRSRRSRACAVVSPGLVAAAVLPWQSPAGYGEACSPPAVAAGTKTWEEVSDEDLGGEAA